MDSIKKYFNDLKKCDEKIKILEARLEKLKEAKKHIECKHDLVFVFNKDSELMHGKCLICDNLISVFNYYVKDFKTHKFQDYENKAGFIDENTLIDATSVVPKRTLELYNCGDYCSAVRARVKFMTLVNGDEALSRDEVKKIILEDALKYDQELFGIPEYTDEEIRMAMQPDDNTEIINAVCEECVDLCSENAKRKIK